MKLQWLRSFVVFVEELNFTRAAARLHLSQPALHTQVRLLSEHLGVPLYRSVGRALVLTDEGERCAAFARDTVQRQQAFEQELAGGPVPSLTLVAGAGAYLYLLGEGIERYLAADGTRLALMVGNRDHALDAIRSGRADVGITVLDAAPADLQSVVLAVVGHALAVPEDDALADRERLGHKDLRDQQLIVPPSGAPQRVMLDAVLGASGIDWRVAVEATGWELVLKLVSLGVGNAVVNDCVTAPPGVRLVPIRGFSPIRYRMVWRAEREAISEPFRAVLLDSI